MEILQDEEHPMNDHLLSDEMSYAGERRQPGQGSSRGAGRRRPTLLERFQAKFIDDPTSEKAASRPQNAELLFFLNISSKNFLQTTSEVGWITKDKLILTLNNDYYLINLKHKDLIKVKNNIIYGKQ